MAYHLAIIVEPGSVWTETFGSKDKSDVDFEIQCWKDNDRHIGKYVHRKTFPRVPTQQQIEDFAAQY